MNSVRNYYQYILDLLLDKFKFSMAKEECAQIIKKYGY